MGGVAGIVWQFRQAWFSEASGFCGRLGWWQVVHATPGLPACFTWSKVTAPSLAGSVILPLGSGAAGSAGVAGWVAAGLSACVVGGGAEIAAAGGGGGACGCAASVVTGAFGAVAGGRAVATAGAVVPAGCGRGVVVGPGSEVTGGASAAATPSVDDAGRVVTGACSPLPPQAKASGARKKTAATRRAGDIMDARVSIPDSLALRS
jgi:hypothetical protein